MHVQPLESRRLFAVNLDPGFGTGGFATLDGVLDTREFASGFAMDVLSDDRVVAVAQVDGAAGQGIVGLARWTANGALDTTFGGGDGVVTTDLPAGGANAHTFPRDLAVQADGKVVVLASTIEGDSATGPWDYGLALLRYNADGTPDTTFGSDGTVRVTTSADINHLRLRLLAGGKLGLVGMLSVMSSPNVTGHLDPLFGRFNADGSPDTSLSDTGLMTYDSVGHWNYLDDIQIGPGGESYVLATAGEEDLIVRFTADGNRDATFTPDAALPFDPHFAHGALELDVQDDGKLLISGSAAQGDEPCALLARLNTDGSLDATFADGGLLAGAQERFSRTWIMSDGEIVTRAYVGNNDVFHRFDAAGDVTDLYWHSGVLIHSDTSSADVGVQSSGKLILGGPMDPDGNDTDFPFGLARVTGKPAPFGNGNAEQLWLPEGTAGNDVVTVNVGATAISVVFNGTPLEYARGSFTRVHFNAGDGNDTLTFNGTLPLYVDGGGGDDSISGGDVGDWMTGGGGADTLNGGAGFDTLNGGDGDDLIDGGADNDAGIGGGGSDTLTGGAGGDTLSGGDGDDLIDGGAGNDSMYGGAGNDVMHGGDGDDQAFAEAGQDTVFTEGGNDHAYGGEGADLLHGGAGSDRMRGDAGRDRLYGGDGMDFLEGNGGDDRLFGHDGMDKLYGDGGNDTMQGGDGPDFLWGHGGDDSLDGGGGTDGIFAHSGDDTLRGGHGNDYMDGGAGSDLITGYAGNDRFIANDGFADALSGGPNDDEAEIDELLDELESTETVT